MEQIRKNKKLVFAGVILAAILAVSAGVWIYAATYYSSALLVSSNILAGQTINSIDYFGYNCSIPANTSLKVQFSQNGTSWYSAGHIADTWTDLVDGSHLDSAGGALGLSGFEPEAILYYRVQFNTSDTAVTPNLVSVNIIYNSKTYGSVTTQPATSVMGVMATGNGNITSIGDSAATKRGFQYGTSQTLGLREVSETGSFGTGAFSLTLTNLYTGTLYYVRAFAQNTEGKFYGDWQEFTTLNNYYYSSAVVSSANLLAGQTINNINGFYASMDMPEGTSATAQFSQNNSTWYSAAGTPGGTTSLQDGGNQIDLTPLAWSGSGFYYKIALNSNANKSATPVLESVALNYNVSSYPSDNNSSVSTPTWATNDVVFSITATDFESDDYYLAICKTNSVTPNNNAAPACPGGSWCVSGATAVGSQATCSYETQISDEGNNAWYAFVCDHDPDSSCSIAMQGSGDSGSPFVVDVDSTPPSASDDFSNNNIWVNSNQTITLTSSDSESGVAWTKYCQDTLNTCDPSSETDYTGPVEISTENISYFRYASTDNVGNTQPTASLTVKIDKTAPVTTAAASGYVFGQETKASVNISLSCADGSGSGCNAIKYCIDGGNSCSPDTAYTSPVTIYNIGTSYFRYFSTDNVQNSEAVLSGRVVIVGVSGGGFPYFEAEQEPQPELPQEDPGSQEIAPQDNKNIISQLGQHLENLIEYASNLLTHKDNEVTEIPEIIIPQETPPAFEDIDIIGGLSTEGLEISFIGNDIGFFSQKLPSFFQSMQDLGVSDLSSLKELSGAEFILPNLASLVSPESDIADGTLPGPIVSIAGMNHEEKVKIPTDIIFARSSNELIEHNTTISINESGEVEQKISIIAGQPVELIVKPDQPAKRITGLVILKNKPQIKGTSYFDFLKYFSAALTGPVADQENSGADGLLLDKFEYYHIGDGVYKATLNTPVNEGEYEVITIIEYQNKNLAPKGIRLIAVVDPEGYVFRKLPQGELRIRDAMVFIYWLNPETGEYELWPAKKYFQENPQTTNDTGKYVFLVPEGLYCLKAQALGYYDYESAPFSVVKEIGVHKNIELKKKITWQDWLDWKMWAIIILLFIPALIVFKYIKNLISKNGKTKNI